MTTNELLARGIGHNCLSDAYELGRADAIKELISKARKYTHIERRDIKFSDGSVWKCTVIGIEHLVYLAKEMGYEEQENGQNM